MASQTASLQGVATEATFSHYRQLTKAGAGLIFVEYTSVHSSGRSEENQLAADSDEHIEGLAKIAEIIKNSGAVAGLQLSHGGGKTERALTNGILMSPSGIKVPVKDSLMETPTAMSVDDIELWKNAFLRATQRARSAGFEAVELHAAHGYGLNQWLSPMTNQRTDAYGGSLTDRLRILTEIIELIRIHIPDILISVRMPGQDFLENGLKPEDSVLIAQKLEAAGVDLIHVSSGIGGWRRPGERTGEGYLVSEAAQIQARVKTPVIGVGGIVSGTYIDQGLQKNLFSLAAVGRAILGAPQDWGTENLSQLP